MLFFFRKISLISILSLFIAGCASQRATDQITQTSTIDALLAGAYDGDVTCEELLKYGDFGIGTFDHLDGEMILLDGEFFQVKHSGEVVRPKLSTETPFASVSMFNPEGQMTMYDASLRRFTDVVDRVKPNKNAFFAVKIKGAFSKMKVRSVPAQKKPYPPLVRVVRHQSVFSLDDVSGTVIGYRLPPFVKGINVPGYHLHFLSEDKKLGGHVLDFQMKKGVCQLEQCDRFLLLMPQKGSKLEEYDLSRDRSHELEKVEK